MTFFLMVTVALFALVGVAEPTADNRPHPKTRTPTDGLEKTLGSSFILAISPRKSGPHAKSGERSWGKSIGNPFILATPQGKAGIAPKLATHGRLWEIPNGTRLSWRFPQEKAALTPKPATLDRFGKNRMGSRLSWRSRNYG